MLRTLNQLLDRARWHVALLVVAGVLWTWLERVHTLLFARKLVRSDEATMVMRFAASAEAHTVLLVAILVTCIACWSNLQRRGAKKRSTHRAKRGNR